MAVLAIDTAPAAAQTLLGATALTGQTVTANAPVLNLSQTWNNAGVNFTGLRFGVTDGSSGVNSLLADFHVNGVSRFRLDKAGGFVATTDGYIVGNLYLQTAGASVRLGPAQDVILLREGANNLGIRNSTSNQKINIYRTFTDASNYERLSIDGSNIQTEQSGSGIARNLGLGTNGNVRWFVSGPDGHLLANTDGEFDLGAMSANRPRNGFFGGYICTLSVLAANLPSASIAGAGARAFVTNASSNVFLSVVSGGGAHKVPVFSDGVNWLVG